ncbi:MAG: hypothetical protein WC319_15060 [Candidatus Paceibacterota bacterium]
MGKFIDLLNKKFGKLVVVERSENSVSNEVMWKCACDCGNITTVRGQDLRSGNTISCGCLRSPDLSGQRFGRWYVITRLTSDENGDYSWLCQCDCGKVRSVLALNLKSGHSNSCGCTTIESVTTHGLSKHPDYDRWRCMMERCYNKAYPEYHYYGGRGITVCNEWHNVVNFCAWADTIPHDATLSIDRIDNNKGYYPENCTFATAKEQARTGHRRKPTKQNKVT